LLQLGAWSQAEHVGTDYFEREAFQPIEPTELSEYRPALKACFNDALHRRDVRTQGRFSESLQDDFFPFKMDVSIQERQTLSAKKSLHERRKCSGALQQRGVNELLACLGSCHHDSLVEQESRLKYRTIVSDAVFDELKRILCVRQHLSDERKTQLARRQRTGRHHAPAAPGALTAPI
jgi:hypothetical protein